MVRFNPDMKTILIVLSLFAAFTAYCQLDNAYIRNDSVFLYKQPIHIRKKDTVYSASDGAFYYYLGS